MGRRKIQDTKSSAPARSTVRKKRAAKKEDEYTYRLPTAHELKVMESLARPKISVEEEIRIIAEKQRQYAPGAEKIAARMDAEEEAAPAPQPTRGRSPIEERGAKGDLSQSMDILRRMGFKV